MDPRFSTSREDLYNLQMELKQVQYTQNNHAERLLRLEKRQADEASIKSVWNSPFPGVLSGTPQTGPVQMPHADVFDDLDEQGEQLLGSLHLGPAEEEPVRRGAASRANSVRFDESALHGSNWAGQSSRHSGEFGPVRPGSGLMMERSLSHKSDGRHSSAGHSVHSVHSLHSVQSGRASSLGLDNNFAVEDDDDSSFEIPGPPPAFYVLGTVPSIVRCWLTTNFAHATLLYADICSGSQKSTIDYSLLKELDLVDEIERDVDGVFRIRLNVYFAEAVITHHGHRSSSPKGPVPFITVSLDVSGNERTPHATEGGPIRVFIGSDALRAHSADILFSQNTMTLYGNDRDRLQVPFVRPEDDSVFRNIYTTNFIPEKHKLNATATPFVLSDAQVQTQEGNSELGSNDLRRDDESHGDVSPTAPQAVPAKVHEIANRVSDIGTETDQSIGNVDGPDVANKDVPAELSSSEPRRESTAGIWGSWRHGGSSGNDSSRESGPLSGYQPAGRGNRNMKVLRPQKSGSVVGKPGTSYEPPPSSKSSSDGRRRSQPSLGGENGNIVNRWDTKRVASVSGESKLQPLSSVQSLNRNTNTLPRSANPVGVASAFSWMTPSTKPKGTTTGME
ncbi:hypothetical protein BGZ63DRAFT_420164 [Mariannaea sp. PMI_226]|nr:hypothetical protein BGZ63DRAFT_420164 [Mariannaea sp. PMI_226]